MQGENNIFSMLDKKYSLKEILLAAIAAYLAYTQGSKITAAGSRAVSGGIANIIKGVIKSLEDAKDE